MLVKTSIQTNDSTFKIQEIRAGKVDIPSAGTENQEDVEMPV